jgi:mycothiol synthase
MRPDELEELNLRRERLFDVVYRYEISRGGTMLSWFGGGAAKPGAPGYDSNRHLFGASWSVRTDHRRRGIGSAWLPVVLELMDRHGCTVLTVESEEESGHAFLRWLGAEARYAAIENRLKLSDVDWHLVRRWIEEGPRRSPDTRLEVYDGGIPEAMWDDYAPQFSRLLNSIPLDQLDHGEFVITPAHMRDWYERMALSRERGHAMILRESDGTISGLTETSWAPYRPTLIHQMLTGVIPAAQGRGLGKWVKAAMLMHLRDLYPDARWIATDNAASNARMQAINAKLGFKRYQETVEYQISRDRLAAKVGKL